MQQKNGGVWGNLLKNGILAIFRQRKDWLNPDLLMEKAEKAGNVAQG